MTTQQPHWTFTQYTHIHIHTPTTHTHTHTHTRTPTPHTAPLSTASSRAGRQAAGCLCFLEEVFEGRGELGVPGEIVQQVVCRSSAVSQQTKHVACQLALHHHTHNRCVCVLLRSKIQSITNQKKMKSCSKS